MIPLSFCHSSAFVFERGKYERINTHKLVKEWYANILRTRSNKEKQNEKERRDSEKSVGTEETKRNSKLIVECKEDEPSVDKGYGGRLDVGCDKNKENELSGKRSKRRKRGSRKESLESSSSLSQSVDSSKDESLEDLIRDLMRADSVESSGEKFDSEGDDIELLGEELKKMEGSFTKEDVVYKEEMNFDCVYRNDLKPVDQPDLPYSNVCRAPNNVIIPGFKPIEPNKLKNEGCNDFSNTILIQPAPSVSNPCNNSGLGLSSLASNHFKDNNVVGISDFDLPKSPLTNPSLQKPVMSGLASLASSHFQKNSLPFCSENKFNNGKPSLLEHKPLFPISKEGFQPYIPTLCNMLPSNQNSNFETSSLNQSNFSIPPLNLTKTSEPPLKFCIPPLFSGSGTSPKSFSFDNLPDKNKNLIDPCIASPPGFNRMDAKPWVNLPPLKRTPSCETDKTSYDSEMSSSPSIHHSEFGSFEQPPIAPPPGFLENKTLNFIIPPLSDYSTPPKTFTDACNDVSADMEIDLNLALNKRNTKVKVVKKDGAISPFEDVAIDLQECPFKVEREFQNEIPESDCGFVLCLPKNHQSPDRPRMNFRRQFFHPYRYIQPFDFSVPSPDDIVLRAFQNKTETNWYKLLKQEKDSRKASF